MTLEILEGLRAFHVGRDWFAANWLRPVKRGVGQNIACVLASSMAWTSACAARIGWACQAIRCLPQEGAPLVHDDDVVRARQLLLDIEGNLDDQTITATATEQGARDPVARAPRIHPYDLIQWAWCAFNESRERARLGESLQRLSDWELKDIGIYRGEIERIVTAEGQAVQQDTTSIEWPEQCDPLGQHRPV
jgi:uncharacterized protein YjiS (DUF1127 family)